VWNQFHIGTVDLEDWSGTSGSRLMCWCTLIPLLHLARPARACVQRSGSHRQHTPSQKTRLAFIYLPASGRCAESRHGLTQGKLTHRFLISTVNKSLIIPLECPRDKLIHLRNLYILRSEAALPDNQSWRHQVQTLQPVDHSVKIHCRKFLMNYVVT